MFTLPRSQRFWIAIVMFRSVILIALIILRWNILKSTQDEEGEKNCLISQTLIHPCSRNAEQADMRQHPSWENTKPCRKHNSQVQTRIWNGLLLQSLLCISCKTRNSSNQHGLCLCADSFRTTWHDCFINSRTHHRVQQVEIACAAISTYNPSSCIAETNPECNHQKTQLQ